MVTDTNNSNLDDEDRVIPPSIYPEDSNGEESPRNPPCAEPTPEPGPTIEKPTKEPKSEPDYDAQSEPAAPTREGSMGRLSPKDIVRYHKWSNQPIFATLEERTT